MSSRPDLRVDDEVGFIRFYRSLASNSNDETIRVFDRGDWYSAHGAEAEFIARTVYKTTSVLRNLGRSESGGLPSVTMSVTVFRNFLREALFRLNKRIEIWGSVGTGKGHWKLVKQASPGNLQDVEEELGSVGGLNMDSAPIILAVKISAKATEARSVGVCFADASVRELGVSEFLDNDIYSNFESLIIQLGVKECLVQMDANKKDVELGKIRTIADSCGIAISERPVADFGVKDIEQDLTRLLRDERSASTLPQTELKLAMGSAAALIKYLGVMSDPTNFGQYQLYQHDLSQFMKLDASALRALNLMPGPRDGSKSMSLFGLLNHCKTPVGSRLLAQWLKQPLMDLAEIEKRQQLVEAFVVNTELRQTMQEEHLRSIPDLYRLAKRFQRKQANLEDVVRVYQVAIRLPGFVNSLENVMDEEYQTPLETEYTSNLRSHSDSLAKLEEMVETTVDLDALENHEFIIKPEFDESLRIIRKKLDKIRHDMGVEHRRVGRDLDQEMDKKLFLENHRVHGWCFRLTRNEAGCIRNKREYQECSTQKNGVYFTTSTMQTLRREHDQLSSNYNRTQTGLVNEVVNVATSYCPVLERLAGVLAHLDVIVSFAHASVHAPSSYVRPKMHPRGTGNTVLKEARHPCMEMQDDISFITNDVSLIRDESSFLIITGPNMGGKSTYIRQIGVIALMAQTGCFVPCTEAELTIFDCILARVGASDSQLKGVSTFMAEMLETSNILKSATSESLIIIDELGRGTSTYDGFGLAWAISEHIVTEIRCFGLFATHFHELTALADRYPKSVKNLHVVAFIGDGTGDDCEDKKSRRNQVTLLYRVEPGICDQSFGIHVAELVRFPDKVVNMARQKAEELEDFTSSEQQGEHSSMAIDGYSQDEVEEGNALLKAMLLKWKAETESSDKKLTVEEKRQIMRDLVKADEKLQANKIFQGIKPDDNMLMNDGLLRVFWPYDLPRSSSQGVIVGWKNSELDLFVLTVLEDVEPRNVDNALRAGILFRNSPHPIVRIFTLCGRSAMHVLGTTNPREPSTAFNPSHLYVNTHPSCKVPRIYCPPETNMSVQVIMFHRPHPTRMEYMSLEPISLALGDKVFAADKSDSVSDKIDTDEERDKVKSQKLVEKLKLHTVVKHVPSYKEQALTLIINQVNCAYEMGKLMEKNSHLIGIRVKRSMSVGERVVESATTLWDLSVLGVSYVFWQWLWPVVTRVFVIGLVFHRTIAEIVLQVLEWRARPDAAALKDISATAQQVDIRLQQFCYWPIQYVKLRQRKDNWESVTTSHPDYIRFYNSLWLVANDVIIGIALGSYIIDNANWVAFQINIILTGWTVEGLQRTISWLMDWPAGLKLNNELAAFLGDLFLWVIENWADLVSILTVHIYSFYIASARIFNWQLTIIISLFHLFRGKKRNVLRNRIDSCDYDLDQLLIGTILFTVLFFLLPTIIVFYLAFATARMSIISVKAALDTCLAFLNHFPLFALMLRVKDSRRLPGGIHFELREEHDKSLNSDSTSTVPYIHLESIPLTLRAMFDQYFQLGHRLRKHYLSPRVIFCLVTGRFVPPIHRRNLYSMQYSMLPARRSGMAEVWSLLTQPRKVNSSSGSSSTMGGGIGTTANGLLKVPSGFGQGDMRRRGHR
ncbi:muts domain V-domain-containing protein [Aspergillus alliaceus]|uniref:DNA mismatch repair protein MSH3 n=1 Tax=Petromyces alliaceus TaxID=209559 RepID=A0A5N6FK88_PETAA|nr:muts domain V-domain-containing protein [Aspergillus alliaceus]KAB8230039.1 muts domain V-domain-containing protein [Aspergillus alliaceus]KAE8388565.1 muts domain V-domain-containing protein [Aspergillus alliaceus]